MKNDNSQETEILRDLSQIRDSGNYVAPLIRMIDVKGGSVIVMPGGYEALEDVVSLRSEQADNFAYKLLACIDFMHRHNVAHRDIKPANIVVSTDRSHLLIIDFSLSCRTSEIGRAHV